MPQHLILVQDRFASVDETRSSWRSGQRYLRELPATVSDRAASLAGPTPLNCSNSTSRCCRLIGLSCFISTLRALPILGGCQAAVVAGTPSVKLLQPSSDSF